MTADATGDRVWQFTCRPDARDVAEGLFRLSIRPRSRLLRAFNWFNNLAVGAIWGLGAAWLGLTLASLAGVTSPLWRLPFVFAFALIGIAVMRQANRAWMDSVAEATLWPEDDRWTISSHGLRVENSQRIVDYTWPTVRKVASGPRAINVLAGGIILTLPRAALTDEAGLLADIARWRG